VSVLFNLDPKTVRRGLIELELEDDPAPQRVRKKGGGRQAATERQPRLEDHFQQTLAEFTAGDPMREGVLWTNLSRRKISRRLAEMGTPASRHTVRKLMKSRAWDNAKCARRNRCGRIPTAMRNSKTSPNSRRPTSLRATR
jgi:hypothetical protein